MITTHVLDTARGVPAAGLDVTLERRHASAWSAIGRATTDAQGRVTGFSDAPGAPLATFATGTYRLTFDTGAYHRTQGIAAPFFPEVKIVFSVRDAGVHHHVPLLLSPFAYSTYRGT
jgi:5-hydroxyisourate hydrolase